MRKYENGNIFKKVGIKPHQIVVAVTTEPDYEMGRKILLQDVEGLEWKEYLLLEGWHCSCYDFDETDWDGIIYSESELKQLAIASYNEDDVFWKEVLRQIS